MTNKILLPAGLFLVAAFLQLTIAPLLTLNSIGPDFILILVAYYGMKFGQRFGMIYGFSAGLFFDIVSGGMIGSSMFSKTTAGFTAGFFYVEPGSELRIDSLRFLTVVFFCALLDSFFYSIFSTVEIIFNFYQLVFIRSILPSVYTTILSLPVIFLRNRGA